MTLFALTSLFFMKLFNSIPAGASGTVEQFFVENAEPVDLHQAIVSIRLD